MFARLCHTSTMTPPCDAPLSDGPRPHSSDDAARSMVLSFFFNVSPPTEIYTLSLHDALPISARKFQISPEGGDRPLWRADGKALFFVDMKGRLMSVSVIDPSTMETGAPTPLQTLPAPNPAEIGRAHV